jgi:hypothetical protein
MICDQIHPVGDIERIVEWRDGSRDVVDYHNTILLTGRRALTKSLANAIEDTYEFYITRMLFGDGGTQAGVKQEEMVCSASHRFLSLC